MKVTIQMAWPMRYHRLRLKPWAQRTGHALMGVTIWPSFRNTMSMGGFSLSMQTLPISNINRNVCGQLAADDLPFAWSISCARCWSDCFAQVCSQEYISFHKSWFSIRCCATTCYLASCVQQSRNSRILVGLQCPMLLFEWPYASKESEDRYMPKSISWINSKHRGCSKFRFSVFSFLNPTPKSSNDLPPLTLKRSFLNQCVACYNSFPLIWGRIEWPFARGAMPPSHRRCPHLMPWTKKRRGNVTSHDCLQPQYFFEDAVQLIGQQLFCIDDCMCWAWGSKQFF